MGVEIMPSALKMATRILSSCTRTFLPLTSASVDGPVAVDAAVARRNEAIVAMLLLVAFIPELTLAVPRALGFVR